MVDTALIIHQKRTFLMQFFINLLLIEAILFPQNPECASNSFRFGEEPDKLTKMLPEPNNTILMSVPDGTGWYLIKPNGTRWYQMKRLVPNETGLY